MALPKVFILSWALLGFLATCSAENAQMQHLIDEENQKCESGVDSMSCIKVSAMRFLDTVMNNSNFKISDVEVKENGYKAPIENQARSSSEDGIFDAVENYIQGHDMSIDLPIADAKVTVSSRNLANDELGLSLRFTDSQQGVVEGKGKKGNLFKKGKKRRLRKLIMPIMVLLLLKTITVIPMAIGILKIKALNALGLGFLSFIVSVGLAIFQLCKKLASEHHSAHITSHAGWEGRMFDGFIEQFSPLESAQELAYKVHASSL